MRVLGNLLKIDILRKLHILGVDAQDLHAADLVWDADIDLPIESTSSSQRWVNRIRSVGRCNDNNLTSSFGTIH